MTSPWTVLYVEDDEDDQQIMQEAFTQVSDHRLEVFFESEQLFAYLEEHKADVCLIILDVNLPGMDGIELFEDLVRLSIYPEVPVVIYTWCLLNQKDSRFQNSDIFYLGNGPHRKCGLYEAI